MRIWSESKILPEKLLRKWLFNNELRFYFMKMNEEPQCWHPICVTKTMKIIRTAVLMFLAASIPMAVTVKANSVVLTQGSYSYDVGGEFTATTSQSFLNNYVPSTIVNGGFETFCIETTVDFTPGSTYSYNLSNTDSQGRQLTEGAAFLYYKFAKGTLTGYVYNNGAQRQTDAGLLQAAIWWLQGNQTYSDGNYQIPNTSNNPFYALAVNTLGSINATNANNGKYGVDVLQMWDGRTPAQNQLVLVPDGGLTAGLLGMGLVGMFLVQSRRRKSS
jgi:hypothetical protein